MLIAPLAQAAAPDTLADALVEGAGKPAITPNTVSADFGRMTKFVRHDGGSMVLFTDGGMTDGYVRHAQAHFDTAPALHSATNPLFAIAFELVEQQDFTFEGLASALELRLGTPDGSSNQRGATFRTWHLKQNAGRTLTIAKAQASDNGDAITIVQLTQTK